MKTHTLLPICLGLIIDLSAALEVPAQSAQILHYGGTALPPGSAADTAFCKGQSYIEIHGINFMAVPAPWLWDSITLELDGVALPIGFLLDTEIHTAFPSTFQGSACPVLTITQHAHAGATATTFSTSDTICLIGDDVSITYPPQAGAAPTSLIWCIGQANPRPSITLGPGTLPGAFCCPSPPSLIVLPDGEIPLHSGATGTATWQYQSGHPTCGDTLTFSATILPQTVSRATIGGAIAFNVCQSAPTLRADSPDPAGGRFVCDDAGLYIADDSMGLIAPRLSRAGTYVLRYVPSQPCATTATITITVQPAPGAALAVDAACDGLPVTATASSQGMGGLQAYHWTLNDSAFEASSGWDAHSFPALQDGDSIGVVVENFFSCVDSAGLRVAVLPRPSLVLAGQEAVVGLPVWEVVSTLDNTALDWSLSETPPGMPAKIPVMLATGSTLAGTAGAWVGLEPQAALPGYVPAAFSLVCLQITGEAGGCPADTLRDCAQVIPGPSSASGAGIFIPEAMTPNGDGMNDVWELRWPDTVQPGEYTLELFNGAGGRVLHMQGLRQGWDGERLADGVYWWVLARAGQHVDAGGLTIRRK